MPALDAADPLATCNDGRRVVPQGRATHTRALPRDAACAVTLGVHCASASELQ